MLKRLTSFLLALVLFAGLVLTGAPVAYAASEMTVSDAMLDVLKQEEGFAQKPYWDYGQWTVGYGTVCPSDMVEYYTENGITEEEAETLLRNYLANTENAINKKFIDKYNLTLTQGQFDALASFTYNCGTAWIYETDGIFHNTIKNGTTGSELIRAFSLWCSAGGQILPGLVRRRLSEASMYLEDHYGRYAPSNYCYVYYSANGGTVSKRIQGYDANLDTEPAYTPTYGAREFLGWYTAHVGGTKVTKLTKSMSGSTLYAHWGELPEGEDTSTVDKTVEVVVTGNEVNLRKGPGTNYGIVGKANSGDRLTITEVVEGTGYRWGNAGDKWICLQYTNYDEALAEKEQGGNKPETSVPETSAPETTVPETTVPETTVPETTVPETTVPEPTVPETTVPEPTVPETTVPEPTVPETTVPETTVPAVTGKVKANGGLSVREGPGTGYARVRYLDNGSAVTILEQKTAGNMTWGRIRDGWISMSYVVLDKTESKPAEPEPTVPKPTVPETTVPETTVPAVTGKVKANGGLSVRNGPGTSYSVRRYLADGSSVTVTEQKDINGVNWGKISDGWICMNYVVLDNQNVTVTKTVKADCLRVRSAVGTSSTIVGYVYYGARVTVTEIKYVGNAKWGKISNGWVSMDYLE